MGTSDTWSGQPRSSGTLQQARRQLDWPEEREFRVLSIDGGGIKGIFAAAFLARLELSRLGGRSIGRYFDLITGTSTGGIIAIALAAGISAQRILDLYVSQGREIFPRRRDYGFVRPAFKQLALAGALRELFGVSVLGDVTARLCIPSADGRHGDVAVFKTPHHPDYRRDWRMSLVDVGLATSAAPTFLKVHEADGYRFIDGGVWANNPVMVGVVDTLSCFSVARRKVRVLSIGNGTAKPLIGPMQLKFGGVIGWVLRGPLVESFVHYSSLNADGQAGLLLGRDHVTRIEPDAAAAAIHMTDHRAASQLLPVSAADQDREKGAEIARHFLMEEAEMPGFYYGGRATEVA